MSDFEHYLTDSSYARAYGFNGKGLIYVENERDCAFWEEIIEATNPEQYEIKRSITDDEKSRGKRRLERLYGQLNESVLVAIDADFDYLCPNKSDSSSYVSGNYILHTFSYSRESVMCNEETINDTIKKIRFYEKANFSINDVLIKYSSLCYKTLPPFLFLLNNRNDLANEQSFHDDLTINQSKETPLFKNNFEFNFGIFEAIDVKTSLRLERYMAEITSKNMLADYVLFKDEILKLGLNEGSAYRFISGHLLYENLILPILKKIKSNLLTIEVENVKFLHEGDSQAIKENVAGLRNHFTEKCSYITMMENCEKTKKDPIYLSILDKALKIRM